MQKGAQRRLALVWMALIMVVLVMLAWLIQSQQFRPQTDLLRLLPETDLPDNVSRALRQVETNTTDEFLLYVLGNDRERVAAGARTLREALFAAGLVAQLDFTQTNRQAELLQALKAGRYSLLTQAAQQDLVTEKGQQQRVTQAVRRLYQPVGSNPLASFDEDPLGLFAEYVMQLPKPQTMDGWKALNVNNVPIMQHEGLLLGVEGSESPNNNRSASDYSANDYSAVLYGRLRTDDGAGPYSPDTHHQLEQLLDSMQQRLASTPALGLAPDAQTGLKIVYSGAVFHISAATQQARFEMSTIGTGSLIGIALLLLISFRAVRPVLLSIGAIVLGVASASVVTLLVFGEIHVLTLVFGASLTGMSIDYAFHYFAAPEREHGLTRIQQVMPGITIGVITSVVAFFCLLLAPFPGLQQMAVFAAVGLAVAYGCVVAWFPLLSNRLPGNNQWVEQKIEWLFLQLIGLRHWLVARKWVVGLLSVGVALFTAIGLYSLTPNDDIRLLYQPNEKLTAMETAAQSLQRTLLARQFLLFGAASQEELIALEAGLRAELDQLIAQQKLQNYWSFGQYLPTTVEQADNYSIYAQQVVGGDEVTGNQPAKPTVLSLLSAQLGLEDSWLEQQREQFAAQPAVALSIDQLATQYPESFGQFWLGNLSEDEESTDAETAEWFAVMALSGPIDNASLEALAARYQADSSYAAHEVHFIDRVSMTSAAFKRFRALSLWFTALAYAGILLILIWRYAWRDALQIFASPFLAAVLTMAILGWAGILVNLFSAFALIVVLGIGIDYAVFFAESGQRSRHTMLAVTLSATTTILAFGLLALSETQALHMFGLTLWIGITLAFLLAPIFAPNRAAKLAAARNAEAGN